MVCFINGKRSEFGSEPLLCELISSVGLNADGLVVVVDGEVVASEAWSGFRVKEGQKVELLSFVSGG